MLADLASAGHMALASSGHEEAMGIAAGRHLFALPAGATFSLIGFSPLRGVHLKGARWPLHGEDLPFATTRPLSNVAEGPIELTIGEGRGVLIVDLRDIPEAD
jgi:thiamine pyrophosphokinase